MRRMLVTVLAVVAVVAVTTGSVAQPSPLITDVRAAIKANDLPKAAAIVAGFRKTQGVTPEMLEALSWIGRGALAASDLDQAERVARETYELSAAELKVRPLDQEPRLPIALGAAIEVLGQVQARRGERTDGVVPAAARPITCATASARRRRWSWSIARAWFASTTPGG